MIQRIQSIYLLAIFGLLLSMFFTKIAEISYKAGDKTRIEADGSIVTTRNFMDDSVTVNFVCMKFAKSETKILWASLIVLILATALPLFNIFTFHNRRFQLKMCFVEGVLLFGLIGFELLYIKNISDVTGDPNIENTVDYGISAVFPLISLILVFLAGKGIIKDEALITACDRLR